MINYDTEFTSVINEYYNNNTMIPSYVDLYKEIYIILCLINNQNYREAISKINEMINIVGKSTYLLLLLSKCYFNLEQICDTYSILKQVFFKIIQIHIKDPYCCEEMDTFALILKTQNTDLSAQELKKYFLFIYSLSHHFINNCPNKPESWNIAALDSFNPDLVENDTSLDFIDRVYIYI